MISKRRAISAGFYYVGLDQFRSIEHTSAVRRMLHSGECTIGFVWHGKVPHGFRSSDS